MADYTPVYRGGDAITLTASATVTGGQLVEVTGSGTVGPAAAGSTKAVGVAAFDAATNARVTVYAGRLVHEVTAAAAITAGQALKAAASGQVTPWVSGTDGADLIVGIALTTAASAAKCRYVAR